MRKQVTYTTVEVVNDSTLIDAKSVTQAYTSTRNLVPGSYVVMWRADAVPWRYDSSASFFGPFASQDQVKGWLQIFVDALQPGLDTVDAQALRGLPPGLLPGKAR